MAGICVFDCDSTLSRIEGVDELARLKGAEALARVEEMTHAAMDGQLAVEEVFGRRLEIIRPTRDEVTRIGDLYCSTLVEGVEETLRALRSRGFWEFIILSGGFRPAIQPLAEKLGISLVEAVDLYFAENGDYTGFAEDYPTTRSGGKPEVLQRLQAERPEITRWVMVGDGVSDLETKSLVDCFIGFGGVVARPKVQREADVFLTDFRQIKTVLNRYAGED